MTQMLIVLGSKPRHRCQHSITCSTYENQKVAIDSSVKSENWSWLCFLNLENKKVVFIFLNLKGTFILSRTYYLVHQKIRVQCIFGQLGLMVLWRLAYFDHFSLDGLLLVIFCSSEPLCIFQASRSCKVNQMLTVAGM